MSSQPTQPDSQSANQAKGKYWLWIAVTLIFIVIIAAWTWLIITAKTNLPEVIPPPTR